MANILSDDSFAHVLFACLSDKDLQQLFSSCGEISLPKISKNAEHSETKEEIVIKFKSKTELLQALIASQKKLNEIKENYAPIHTLPDDCLARIFSYINVYGKLKLEKVCKRWKEISERGWPEIDHFSLDFSGSRKEEELRMMRCGRFVKDLTISLEDTNNPLPAVEKWFRLQQLRKISILCSQNPPALMDKYSKEVAKILRKCKKLSSIGIRANFTNYTVDYLSKLPRKTISSIELFDYSVDQTSFTFSINVLEFPKLRKLSLSWFRVGVGTLEGFERLQNLETLEFTECALSRDYVNNITLLTNLKELSLTDRESSIDDYDIFHIVTNCLNIKTLHLERLRRITPACLVVIGEMPSLENLSLKNLFLRDNFEYLTNIKVLTCEDMAVKQNSLLKLIGSSVNFMKLSYWWGQLSETFLKRVNKIFISGRREVSLKLDIGVDRYGEKVEWKIPKNRSPLLSINLQYI